MMNSILFDGQVNGPFLTALILLGVPFGYYVSFQDQNDLRVVQKKGAKMRRYW